MWRQNDSGLIKNKQKWTNKRTPPTTKQHRLLLNFQPFPLPPSFFTGLSLQADHVPEYRRSLSSHSLRSCNLLRPQCQNAALSVSVVCSLFFSIFLKGRDAQTGCYHYTHFHLAVLVAVLSRVRTKVKFNKLWLFPSLYFFKTTCQELVHICSSVLKANYWAEAAKFQPTANSYNGAVTLQNRDC